MQVDELLYIYRIYIIYIPGILDSLLQVGYSLCYINVLSLNATGRSTETKYSSYPLEILQLKTLLACMEILLWSSGCISIMIKIPIGEVVIDMRDRVYSPFLKNLVFAIRSAVGLLITRPRRLWTELRKSMAPEGLHLGSGMFYRRRATSPVIPPTFTSGIFKGWH